MSKALAKGGTRTRRAATAWASAALILLGATRPALSVKPTPAATAAPPPPAAVPVPALRGAEPSAEATLAAYAAAVNAFKYQDFDSAIPQLRALVYPKTHLDQKREWKAREYLGSSLWWQGEARQASDEFTALLVRNPQAVLDPSVYPPKMIIDFEGLRSNLIRLGVLTQDQAPRPPEPRDLVAPEPAPLSLALFPFGVGQFANREPGKGALFLVAEAALGAVSAGYYVRNTYDGARTGERSNTGDILQISTGAAFLLVAGWGIVDALLQRRSAAARTAP